MRVGMRIASPMAARTHAGPGRHRRTGTGRTLACPRMAPNVTGVVVFYADAAATRAALEALLRQTVALDEVLVVDTSPGGEVVHEPPAGVRVVRPDTTLGYAPACNLAVRETRGEWLFFCNPDTVADERCVERLLDAAEADTAVVGAQVLLPGRELVNAGDNP